MPYDVIRAGDARSILGALLPPGVVAVEALLARYVEILRGQP